MRSLAVVLLTMIMAACTPGGGRPTNLGTLSGRLLFGGGPAPGLWREASGTVTLRGPTTVRVAVDPRGHFEVRIPPATYRATGTSPTYGDGRYVCRAARLVVVRASRTSHIDVVCVMR
jgi:hypothetical protein